MGYPPLDMGWYYLTMVVLFGLLCVCYLFGPLRLTYFFSRYVIYVVVWMCSMVFFPLNSFYRSNNSCMEYYFRWRGMLFLSASSGFEADSMTASSGGTVVFVMYLCLKILSLKLLLHVSHLLITSNLDSVQKMCLVHIPSCSTLRMFCAVQFFCGLKPPLLWVQMAVHCIREDHIGVHRLIF